MNFSEYGEVTNGDMTYKYIAKELLQGKTIGIGWTDQECTHFDIIFKLGLDEKHGSFQRGIQKDDLFVSIIDHTSYGFDSNSTKEGTYIQERLRCNNSCGDKLKELINGIIINLKEGIDE